MHNLDLYYWSLVNGVIRWYSTLSLKLMVFISSHCPQRQRANTALWLLLVRYGWAFTMYCPYLITLLPCKGQTAQPINHHRAAFVCSPSRFLSGKALHWIVAVFFFFPWMFGDKGQKMSCYSDLEPRWTRNLKATHSDRWNCKVVFNHTTTRHFNRNTMLICAIIHPDNHVAAAQFIESCKYIAKSPFQMVQKTKNIEWATIAGWKYLVERGL